MKARSVSAHGILVWFKIPNSRFQQVAAEFQQD